MQEGIEGVDAAGLARRAERGGCWALAACCAPLVAVVLSLLPTHGSNNNVGALFFYLGIPLLGFSLAAAAQALGAAHRLRTGDTSAAAGLGCAARCLILPALLLAIPAVGTLLVGLMTLGSYFYEAHMGDRNAGCAGLVALIFLSLGLPGMLYVVPALVGGAILRRVADALPGR